MSVDILHQGRNDMEKTREMIIIQRREKIEVNRIYTALKKNPLV